NLAPGGFSVPHVGQTAESVPPHDMQKRARSGFSVPQVGHATPPATCSKLHGLDARSVTCVTDARRLAALFDRDLLHAWFVRTFGVVDALQVAVDQGAHREQRLALHGLPLVAKLRRRGGAQDVHGAADGAPLDALELAPGLKRPRALALLLALAIGAALIFAVGHPRSSPRASRPRAWPRWAAGGRGRGAGC